MGIALTKEILIAVAHGKKDYTLGQLMRPVHFVVETAPLNSVLMEFLELKQHLFVVIDEYGGLSGLISLEDVLEGVPGWGIVDESDKVVDKQKLAQQRKNMILGKNKGPHDASTRNNPARKPFRVPCFQLFNVELHFLYFHVDPYRCTDFEFPFSFQHCFL